ncbi:MAG: YjbF family lipoprotein [Pseudomonadota bacterium]
MSIDRRTVLLGLGGAALTSCAAPGSAVYQIVDSYRALDRAKKEYPNTRAQIDAQPLGVMGVQVEDGLKGLVLREKRENGQDYWRSGNGVLLVTQAGRLIRTTGFPEDQLDSQVLSGVEPLGQMMDPALRYEVSRELGFAAPQPAMQANYSLQYVRDVTVQWLGETYEVAEWAETVRLPQLRRKWKQLIQVDRSTGVVLRSIQHVGPKTRVILELLKPPTV